MARLTTIIRDGEWNLGSSNDLTIIELRQLCARINIYSEDKILWDGTVYSKLGIADIWEGIRATGPFPNWYNFVWCKFKVPKYAFNVWLIVQERLLTKDRMNDFHMNTDPACLLCSFGHETHEHLFCRCPFVRNLYASWNVGITLVWDDFKNGNIFTTTGISQIKKEMTYLFVSVVMYSVWRERNKRMHEVNHRRSGTSILDEVKMVVREKLSTSKMFTQKARDDPALIVMIY